MNNENDILEGEILNTTVVDEAVVDPDVLEPEVIKTQAEIDMENLRKNFMEANVSDKNGNVMALLCWFGGILGLHRFYLGRVVSGVFYIFTGGFFGLGVFWDLVCISIGTLTDSNRKMLITSPIVKTISGIWVVFLILSFIFSLFTGAISIIFGFLSGILGIFIG